MMASPQDSKNSLVMASLRLAFDSSVPVALSEGTPANPIPSDTKKMPKIKPPDLLVPLKNKASAGENSYSADESPSPTSPKRWSPVGKRKKLKIRSGDHQIKSANCSPDQIKPVKQKQSRSVPSLPLETTPVNSLPGTSDFSKKNSEVTVPTILVSPDDEACSEFVRKTSQSSHLSAASSTITSGAEKCKD